MQDDTNKQNQQTPPVDIGSSIAPPPPPQPKADPPLTETPEPPQTTQGNQDSVLSPPPPPLETANTTTPPPPMPQQNDSNDQKKENKKSGGGLKNLVSGTKGKIAAGVVGILLLIGSVAAGVTLVGQNQDVREKAAVIQDVPTTTIDNIGGLSQEELNSLIGTEPDRTSPSLIFANGVKVKESERIQLLIKDINTGAEVINNAGFGARMVVELTIDPGEYTLEINDFNSGQNHFNSNLTIFPETITYLLRSNQGTYIDQQTWWTVPDAQIFNMSSDNNIGVFGGNLTPYNGIFRIQSNTLQILDINNPQRIIFGINSTLPNLENRIVEIPNDRKMKVSFFVLGDSQEASIDTVLTPLSTIYQTDSLTQTTTHDPTPQWCEGTYTCQLIDANCSDCGKACFPTPLRCDEGSNGGSGDNWDNSKSVIPKAI